ncbi:uncharacterized protein LOC111642005 [Centruroides sculpturatus]|uniref:uncharacterized protein LOC111642005 n=1 Tax=Centruroides sculpturatus TaxID=218467 RepID=UPI000C6E8836|nr:uncharacterized protein LOC111642005 [Centruroides sculpturatus]
MASRHGKPFFFTMSQEVKRKTFSPTVPERTPSRPRMSSSGQNEEAVNYYKGICVHYQGDQLLDAFHVIARCTSLENLCERDLSHVLKNICAALLNNVNIILSAETIHKYNLSTNVVDLHHVINLANYQCCELKLAPQHTLQHLSTYNFLKIRVNVALKFFNRNTSTALRYMMDEVGWKIGCLLKIFNALNNWKWLESSTVGAILSTTSVLDLAQLLLQKHSFLFFYFLHPGTVRISLKIYSRALKKIILH